MAWNRARSLQEYSAQMRENGVNAFAPFMVDMIKSTVNFVYTDTRRGIRKVSLFAKCRYTRSPIICTTVGWDFALGMEILSLFANCRYIRSRS